LEDLGGMYLKEVGWEGVDWFYVAQDRTAAECSKHADVSGFIKRREFLD
jgi:hypothetical protein